LDISEVLKKQLEEEKQKNKGKTDLYGEK
jgi:hypothetical protein